MTEDIPQAQQTPELTPEQKEVSALLEAGNLPEARKALESLVKSGMAQGDFHPVVVSSRLLLARVCALLGDPKAAEACLAPLQGMPEDDPRRDEVLLNAQGLVALLWRQQARYEEAFGLFGAILEHFDKLSGDPVNPDSFRAILQMVQIAREGRQLQASLDLCVKGIERFQGKVGEAHAHLLLQAGAVFLAGEQYDQAREHFESILHQVLEQGGQNHELAARAHHFMALLERDLDADDKAIEHLKQCLDIVAQGGDPELVVDAQHQMIQWTLDSVASTDALRALSELHALTARVHGPRSTRSAEILSSMGYHHRRQGDGIAARACYQQAIDIWRAWRAEEDPKIQVLNGILSELG